MKAAPIHAACAAAFFLACGGPPACLAQSPSLPNFGVGAKVSTLGIGVEAVAAVTPRSNLRAGGNWFNYSTGLDRDGVHYEGRLKLRSFSMFFDRYLGGLFHISPGVLAYNGDSGAAVASVPSGQAFTLGGRTYISGRPTPVGGDATLDFQKFSPALLVGFGNLAPRNRRFGVNFEFGMVYQGDPKVKLNLNGTTCSSNGLACLDVAGNPLVQSDIRAQETKLTNNLSLLRYYPVVSLGFGYRF
jgi:hypothetical protein